MTDRIEKIIDLAAPVSRVWRALTDHREFAEWFRAKIDNPFMVGEMQRASSTYPGHESQPWEMKIECMEEMRLFSFIWGDIGSISQGTGEPPTLVEFHLEAEGEGTRLKIIESGFDALSYPRRLDVFRENTQGWQEQACNIVDYLNA